MQWLSKVEQSALSHAQMSLKPRKHATPIINYDSSMHLKERNYFFGCYLLFRKNAGECAEMALGNFP